MSKVTSTIFLLCVSIAFLCWEAVSFAEIKVFEKEVEEAVGRNQSQEAVEAFALQKAKRLAVEEAGTYISSLTVIEKGLLTKSQVTALTAGVVKTEIIGVPRISVKKGIVHVRVKARIQVDTTVLEKKIEALLRDQGLLSRLEEEQEKVRKLEKELAGLKKTELKRLEELNEQAIELEMERERQRLSREERRLKARGAIARVDLEILKHEQERMARFEQLRREQEAARKKELKDIAREQDRLKRAHLENQRYWKALAQKAELSRANWTSIDDMLSLQQAIQEAKGLKEEIASLNQRLDFRFERARDNLREAYKQQIIVTRPILPPDPVPKDPFETTAEYNQRLNDHKRKVQKAKRENEQKIKKYKTEEDLKVAQLKVNALENKLQVLEPFIKRLQDLQSKKFGLLKGKKGKVKVVFGDPDADNSRFPLYIEYKERRWTKYWPYTDRNRARAFWKTRSHLIAKRLFQLESAGKDNVTFRLTAAEVIHPGTNEKRKFMLNKAPQPFNEVHQWTKIRKVELPEARTEEKMAAIVHEGEGWYAIPLIEYKMAYIPPGTFMMGSPTSEKGRDDDEKQHKVTLTKGFYIGATEVTQGQWRKIMGGNPSYFKKSGDDCPVEQVSWNDVQEFIHKLNKREGTKKYRLPTEAEWEYACRAGSATKFSFGNDYSRLGEYAWKGNRTYPVARKNPNAGGLYDMHGNVWEWCKDRYGGYPSGHVTDPKGRSGKYRVFRGGCWFGYALVCRSADRNRGRPDYRSNNVGFRVARDS